MSRSTDPGHFFQTTQSLSEQSRKAAKAKNTHGHPIQLDSKLLAVINDPADEGVVYVAEAAGRVRRIRVEDGTILSTFTGPTAPLTSLAISSDNTTLYAGCWDKSIWTWSLQTRKPGPRFTGHSDFVKALLTLSLPSSSTNPKQDLLISGSADSSIIIWPLSTGEKLHVLKGHTRGILSLALDPESLSSSESLSADPSSSSPEITFLSAGSDREIRRWTISPSSARELISLDANDIPSPLLVHETSVDSIRFDASGDLWTASADKSAKCLSRAHNFTPDTTLQHPDFVRDVLPHEDAGLVITACRDEEVRVWASGSGELMHTYSGHYEEVTGLALCTVEKKTYVVSVSIDGTVRRWSLDAQDLQKAVQDAADAREGKLKEDDGQGKEKESMLTAEEEAELAELLEDSE